MRMLFVSTGLALGLISAPLLAQTTGAGTTGDAAAGASTTAGSSTQTTTPDPASQSTATIGGSADAAVTTATKPHHKGHKLKTAGGASTPTSRQAGSATELGAGASTTNPGSSPP